MDFPALEKVMSKKKKSEKWQEIADCETDKGAKQYAERRAFQERQREDADQDRRERFWKKVRK